MKIGLMLSTLALVLAPALALADCRSGHDTTAASCAAGAVWDATTRTCVLIPTG